MKLITYEQNGRIQIGAVYENKITNLNSLADDMLAFIRLGRDGLTQAKALVEAETDTITLEDVRLLAPIPTPIRNVMCLGVNYAEHASESVSVVGKTGNLPEVPMVFNKATTAVAGPFDTLAFDTAVSPEIDWEAEMAVILGKSGKNIAAADAMSYVYGYTVLNDISARDLQKRGKQFFKGKSLDDSCPMGPYLVTADDIPDPHQLNIACRVNGITKQNSNTRNMIFNIPATIAYLSQGMTLLAGDIIATGTPSGIGAARTPPEFLKSGDVVECEIESIGVIRNQIA